MQKRNQTPMRMVEFVADEGAKDDPSWALRIAVPEVLVNLGRRGQKGPFRKGEVVCLHALLVVVSCLTTRVLGTELDRQHAKMALQGFMYCLAHYFSPWFDWMVDPQMQISLNEFFVHQAHQPRSAPVAPNLFGQWAVPWILGIDQGAHPDLEAALVSAYDPVDVAKVTWAHPIWTILHMIPAATPFVRAPQASLDALTECMYFRALLVSLAVLIPCPMCRSHKWEYCAGKSVEGRGAFRTYVAAWVWEFHNAVNVRVTGRPESAVPLDQAMRFWDAQTHGWWNDKVDFVMENQALP